MSTHRAFRKHVDVVAKDDDEQVAIGAVLVPDEVDSQRDFLRAETIRAAFDDYDEGVMHAVFPDDAASTDYRILEQAEDIGGERLAAGTLLAEREYHDAQLWGLVKDGILGGFSIGGVVHEQTEYAADEVPEDVTFGAGVPEGEAVEIEALEIDEVSDVDIPAVPKAEYAVAKGEEIGKNVLEQADSKADFIALMQERGHSEAEATRLWDALQDLKTKSNDMSDTDTDDTEPADKQLSDEDVGLLKRLREVLSRADDGDVPEDSEKAGRVLSASNVREAKAIHDHAERMLAASNVDPHGHTTRTYTDDEKDTFDLSQAAKSLAEMSEDVAPADDTNDTADKTESMSETETEPEGEPEKAADDEPPEWAESLKNDIQEQLDEYKADLDDLAERVDKVSKATADTDQLGGADESNEDRTKTLELEREVFGR